LEGIYLDSGYEVGTNSIRLFVAWYLDLPFDTTGQEIYLPQSAINILLKHATLTPDQTTYIQTHAVEVSPTSSADVETDPAQSEVTASEAESNQSTSEASTSPSEDYIVKGKTIFGDLIRWGVPQETIEAIIGTPIPDPAMTVKDFATTNGLDFETIKTNLQAEVDNIKP